MKEHRLACRKVEDLLDVQHFDGCREVSQLGVFLHTAWTELTLVSLNFAR